MPNDGATASSGRTVAHVMSRFPQISETFILNEILELERLGTRVEVFSILRDLGEVRHPQADRLAARCVYGSSTGQLASAQLYWLARRPLSYLSTWLSAVRGNLRSAKFLLRTPATVASGALFAREMRRRGVQHIHAHYATHPALAAYVAHRLTGLPYSFTAHAHDIYVERAMLGEKLRNARFAVAISDYNRRLLETLYPEEAVGKLHVVHCGIDPATFSRAERHGTGGRFTLVCVASLQDYKGHRYLVDAITRLRAAGEPVRALLVGEGELRDAIHAQIREQGVEKDIDLLGAQPRERVRELLASADAVVLPSVVTSSGKMEGIPVALMEALGMSLPVVATDISGVSELVEDGVTGLLVPERDPDALAEAIDRLRNDPELGRRLGEAGRGRVVSEFDLRTNTARLDALLGKSIDAAFAS
jgi:glycosyltransferase involved in cell wall biosynthesis